MDSPSVVIMESMLDVTAEVSSAFTTQFIDTALSAVQNFKLPESSLLLVDMSQNMSSSAHSSISTPSSSTSSTPLYVVQFGQNVPQLILKRWRTLPFLLLICS